MSTTTRSSGGGVRPVSVSHRGVREPRPVASTTRSAGRCSSAPARVRSATPVTRRPSSRGCRTSQPSRTSTFGSARTARRTWCSSSSRLQNTPSRPVVTGCSRCPPSRNRMRAPASATTAPSATRSAATPGNQPPSSCAPRASRVCTWWACGTPRRARGPSGSGSRSTSVTRANESARTRAVSRPAMLAPRTTAWSPAGGVMTRSVARSDAHPPGRNLPASCHSAATTRSIPAPRCRR